MHLTGFVIVSCFAYSEIAVSRPVCLVCYCVFIPVTLYVLPGMVSYVNINDVKQGSVLSPIIFTIYIEC